MLRRLSPRRLTAALAAGMVGIAGVVALSAPAQAQQVTYMSQCTNKLAPGLEIPPSETKVDLQVSPVKDKYTVGDLVTVTWKWGSYSNVPPSSPIPSIPADSTKPVGQINLTGAQTGVLTVEGERKNLETPRGEPLVITDMKATLTLTAAGTLNLAPKQHSTFSLVFGIDAETECLPLSTPPISTSITVEEGQAALPELDAPTGEAHPGWTLGLAGRNFAPNATPQLKLCNADGSNCLADRFTANTLAIDGAGKLTGTATLAKTGLPNGDYVISVVDGTAEARRPVTITAYVPPGERSLVIDPAAAPVGGTVTVTGENWTPNTGLNMVGLDASGLIVGSPVSTIFTDHMGKFTARYTVPDLAAQFPVTQIRVREGISSTKRVIKPFTVITIAPLNQDVKVNLAPGTLSMTQAGTNIDFGSVTLNGEVQTLTANLNQVTVVDARGGTLGWALTGTMTDLVAANGTDKIPAGNVSWTPSCAAKPGAPSQVVTGTAGPLGTAAATLCSQAGDSKTTGGAFTGDARLTLTTPQFPAAGAYAGTLTLTLI